jgi:hypothetical protein
MNKRAGWPAARAIRPRAGLSDYCRYPAIHCHPSCRAKPRHLACAMQSNRGNDVDLLSHARCLDSARHDGWRRVATGGEESIPLPNLHQPLLLPPPPKLPPPKLPGLLPDDELLLEELLLNVDRDPEFRSAPGRSKTWYTTYRSTSAARPINGTSTHTHHGCSNHGAGCGVRGENLLGWGAAAGQRAARWPGPRRPAGARG